MELGFINWKVLRVIWEGFGRLLGSMWFSGSLEWLQMENRGYLGKGY